MGHELTMGVSSTGSDQKQQNIFVCISLFWSVALQGHHVQRNGSDHDWLIRTLVSTSDILVIKIILVLVLVSFQSNHFYFI